MKRIIIMAVMLLMLITTVSAIGLAPEPIMKEVPKQVATKCETDLPCSTGWKINTKGNYNCGNLTMKCDLMQDDKFCVNYQDWQNVEEQVYKCPANNITRGCLSMNGKECIYETAEYYYIEMYPEQKQEMWIEIQNGEQTEKQVKVIVQGDIINNVEQDFLLPPNNQDNKKVYFNMTIPKDAVIGQEYNITYGYTTDLGSGSMVSLKTGIAQQFRVKVIDKPKETSKNSSTALWIIGGIGILAMIILAIFLFKKKPEVEGENIEE